MNSNKTLDNQTVADEVLQAFHTIDGPHPTFRPAHARILLAGDSRRLPTRPLSPRAPHAHRASTPVPFVSPILPACRRSPTRIRMPARESMANSLPSCRARSHRHHRPLCRRISGADGGGIPRTLESDRRQRVLTRHTPNPVEVFLGERIRQRCDSCRRRSRFRSVSFQESFFAVNALRFVNAEGAVRHGRFRVHQAGSNQYLDAVAAGKQSVNFLFDEAAGRLQHSSATMRIVVQMAAAGRSSRRCLCVGRTIVRNWSSAIPEVRSVLPNQEAEQQKIIFDPIPRVDGIESAGDPLLEPRATIYLASGRQRRAEHVIIEESFR